MSANRISSHLDQIHWIGQLADLKDHQFQQGLLLDALIELLIEKGVITAQEIAVKAQALEGELTASIPTPSQQA
ncbi:hypothetical protein O9H85_36000 [Paenibacillus filicis]|uniref:Nitrile hydratase subunit beta n=1 Tax=Paenibacillus gyeongsangnamensis TaxID=3388067 RepID=A0ABT4QL95_9BACL|nr:hypothetical protein [Paenibacillus filicis]MCZ8517635.1 hypothetical protein [Paenibacillus filicis]